VVGPTKALVVDAIVRLHRHLMMVAEDEKTERPALRAACARIYPQRCAMVGIDCVDALIDDAARTSVRVGIGTVRGVHLLLGMMLIAGQGVLDDPQHSWAREVIRKHASSSPEERVDALHRAGVERVRLWWGRLA